MSFTTAPGYKVIFPNGNDNIKNLLRDIPTKALLTNLAVINNLIYFKYSTRKILDILLRRNLDKIPSIIAQLRIFHNDQETRWTLFSEYYLAELMMEAIECSNNNPRDTTPEEDFLIFKAYLLIVDLIQNELDKISETINIDQDHSFNSSTWPIMVKQYQFNQNPLGLFQQLKTRVLLSELRRDSKILEVVREYESRIGMSGEDFAYHLERISEQKDTFEKDEISIHQFFFKIAASQSKFLDNLALDTTSITSLPRYNVDYLALKKFPLLKHESESFVFLNRNFFINKIYNGFILDLYYNSKMNSCFSDFTVFKSFIGKEVSENRIFKSILSLIYSKKIHKLYFGNSDSDPDAYLRIGNRIFIFEFKDYLMPSRVVVSHDFEEIKAEIDKKFIKNERGDKKGVFQLLTFIDKINNNLFEFDNLAVHKLRRDKIEIFPIIVYSDFAYSLPGINNYLTGIFKNNISSNQFKKVSDPVMINLNFFFEYLPRLGETRLDKLIQEYQKNIENQRNAKIKTLNPNAWFNENLSFEFAIPFKHISNNSNPHYSELLLNSLGLR